MPELPNLLRQRLAATKNGETQTHPDADTLTAYMEQSLPPAESKTVIVHLSVCESCREVVALSQAVMVQPATQTVLTPAPVARWRRLFTPVFGAAAAVAAMAVIAVMVLQLPQKNPQPSSSRAATSGATTNNPNSQPAQETQQAKANLGDQTAPVESKAAAPAPTQPAEARLSSARSDVATSAKETEARLENSAGAGAAKKPGVEVASAPAPLAAKAALLPRKDYVNTDFFNSSSDKISQDSQGNNLPAAPQPQLGAANTGFSTANNKITIFADLPANAAGNSNVRLMTPAPPPEHLGCTICKIKQTAAHTLGFHSPLRVPALRAGALSSSALGGPGMFSGAIEKNEPSEISAAPAKADSDSFAASSSLSPSAMAPTLRRTESAAPTWKVAGGKLMKSSGQSQWENAYPVASSTMEFSIVNARGNDVWAGGSGASLIHSRDGGQTWETVKLGDNATGTIVSIIAGTMSVQIKTSDNQTWASADGGKTWTQD